MACKMVHCFFVLLLCLVIIQVCVGGRSITTDDKNPKAKNVPVELYYESLCPGCESFIVDELPKIFDNGLIDIVDLKLVPWGNAEVIEPNKTFSCQHGPDECKFNTIEACVIDALPLLDDHIAVIHCVEKQHKDGNSTDWESCCKQYGFDPKPIHECYDSGKGALLEQKYADLTNALKPPHVFVPWLVVNGQPLRDDIGKFMKYICNAYKGKPPSACKEQLSDSLPENNTSLQDPSVCYADKKA